VLSRIAALLFIPLLIASAWLYYKQIASENNLQCSMQEITSPPGIHSQIVLPDGSKVWLNSESTIQFKIPFDSNYRNVKLTGEAYFEVKKDRYRPFQVQSGNVNVTVLGTHFDVKAFGEDSTVEVVLAEGKVSLTINGHNADKELIMSPGERAVINKTTNQTRVKEENIDKYIAWHTGKLVFDDCPMPEVAKELERWFGIEVRVIDPDILRYRITTTFENESLHQVLELLGLSSPIKINYIPARLDGKTNKQIRAKVIITSKK